METVLRSGHDVPRTGRVLANASSKHDKMPLITNFISNWANAIPMQRRTPPPNGKILIGRIAALQKPFGPEFVRIGVDILAVMGQIDTADNCGTRLK
jgi:hypothetical protein